jgi:tetratricopeptide (TPR) repeat protein
VRALLVSLALASTPPEAERVHALEARAAELKKAARFEEAVPVLREVLEARRALKGADDPDTLLAELELASAYQQDAESTSALPLLEHAAKSLRGPAELDASRLPLYRRALTSLAAVSWLRGRREGAERALETCLSTFKAGAPSVDRARVLDELARMYGVQRKRVREEPLRRQALAEWRSVRPIPDRDVAFAMLALGASLASQRRTAEAWPYLEGAVAMLEQALGPDDVDLAVGLNALARARVDADQPDEARRLLLRSLGIAERNGLNSALPVVVEATDLVESLEPEPDAGPKASPRSGAGR